MVTDRSGTVEAAHAVEGGSVKGRVGGAEVAEARALPEGVVIRAPAAADGEAIAAIHAEGLATGEASFRDKAYSRDEWFAAYGRCALVAEVNGAVAGWAGVSATSPREVYRGVGEVSIYVGAAWRGRGIGDALLRALVAASEDAGYWTLVAAIFPENRASVRLHERAGFRVLGVRERIGRMTHGPQAGRWRDVVLLERRSARVGVD